MYSKEPIGNLDGMSEEPLGNLDHRPSQHETLREVLSEGPCTPYELAQKLCFKPGFPDFKMTQTWLSQFLEIEIPNEYTGIVVLIGDWVRVATVTRAILLQDRPQD
jgi:hypothetical protein